MDAFNALMPGSSLLTRGKLAARQQRVPQAGFIPAHAGKTQLPQPRSRVSWAHPRSRGENAYTLFRARRYRGSSPLTRGKLRHFLAQARRGRLIPAHAGKTRCLESLLRRTRAHPRSRGENEESVPPCGGREGSSPLTRGKHGGQVSDVLPPGLIPAHAGKTQPRRRRHSARRAHPRSRGENERGDLAALFTGGSSPLTRGKPLPDPDSPLTMRLIPAHVGKTAGLPQGPDRGWAHPRSRGENGHCVPDFEAGVGSSPLTRGKLFGGDLLIICHRLIPAHAGKTEPYRTPNPADQAHPRSRGENTLGSALAHQPPGSSPLTPGKPPPRAVRGADLRLIPAHAGKTVLRRVSRPVSAAHPRSRGENPLTSTARKPRTGSSPLTRGKRNRVLAWQCAPRLIPAHAGKT